MTWGSRRRPTSALVLGLAAATAFGLSCGFAPAAGASETGHRTGAAPGPAPVPVPAPGPGAAGTPGASTAWRAVPGPNLHGFQVLDISAPAADDAWAVGLVAPGDFEGYALTHWNGARWSRVTPAPWLVRSVEAVGANDVWAMESGESSPPKAHHWNGARWTSMPLPSKPGEPAGYGSSVHDVAAVSTRNVWAVGSHEAGDGARRAEIVHWNGSRWTWVAAPTYDGDSRFTSLAVVSAHEIWAVGTTVDDRVATAIAARWDGQLWHDVPLPTLPRHSRLSGIVAPTSDVAWAVGAADGRPLALYWDGTRWNVVRHTPTARGHLTAIARDGRGGLWAAGADTVPGGALRAYVLHWNGTAWIRTHDWESVTLDALAQVPGTTTVWAGGGSFGSTLDYPRREQVAVVGATR